jgi:hypothetical protein
MGGVFINYRVVDNPLGAAGIHDALATRFGADKIFRDCVSLEAGAKYPTAIREVLEGSDVLVAIVGPRWLTLVDDTTGTRLIDRDQDWVRRELVWAHDRDIPIVPVLLTNTPTDATQPMPDDLPSDLRWFAYLQTFPFSQRTFGADLTRLAARLTTLAPTLRMNGRSRWGGRPFSHVALMEIVDALEMVPCILNEDTRSQVLGLLSPTISGAIPHYSQRRPHVMGILTTCLNYEYGLDEFLAILASFEGDSHALRRLLAVLRHSLPDGGLAP